MQVLWGAGRASGFGLGFGDEGFLGCCACQDLVMN